MASSQKRIEIHIVKDDASVALGNDAGTSNTQGDNFDETDDDLGLSGSYKSDVFANDPGRDNALDENRSNKNPASQSVVTEDQLDLDLLVGDIIDDKENDNENLIGISLPVVTVISITIAVLIQYFAFSRAQTLTEQKALATDLIIGAERVSHEVSSALGNRDAKSFDRLPGISERFDRSIMTLQDSGSGLPGVEQSAWYFDALDGAVVKWNATRAGVAAIIASQSILTTSWNEFREIRKRTDALTRQTTALRNQLLATSKSPMLIHLGGQQQIHAERIALNLTQFASSSSTGHQALKDLRSRAIEFERVYLTLRRQGPPSAQTTLDQLEQIWRPLGASIKLVGDNAATYINIGHAGTVVEEGAYQLVNELESLVSRLNTDRRFGWLNWLPWVMMLVSILCLACLTYRLLKRSQRRLASVRARHQATQNRLANLVNRVATIAEGDLTGQPKVTERSADELADAVDHAVNHIRTLVQAVHHTSQQVCKETIRSRQRAEQLAKFSQVQSTRSTQATAKVSAIATGMSLMSDKSAKSVDVAGRSLDLAKRALQAVGRAIEGFNALRSHSVTMSKRLRHVVRCSDQIRETLATVEELADQSHLLAMNSAIAADSAEGAGREFAIVANEIQALGEQSSDALEQIRKLVQDIQSESHEVVASMELSAKNMTEGAEGAHQAEKVLRSIEQDSDKLTMLLERIARTSNKFAGTVSKVSDDLKQFNTVSQHSLINGKEASGSAGRLASMAKGLRSSVEGFRFSE